MILQIKPDKIVVIPQSEHEHKQLVKILLSISYLMSNKEGEQDG